MNKNLFHIHTKRCGHASAESDEAYVQRAIMIGAQSITFTDHAPFPGNPFGNRMPIEQLKEYVQSLRFLKEKYADIIDIRIGLEIEYLPSYLEYYQMLKLSGAFDILMIGQHFYEIENGRYSFKLSKDEIAEKEFLGCGKAIVNGINSGFFDVVAHPDRMFRKKKEWRGEIEDSAKRIMACAKKHGVMLEQNESSKRHAHYYRDEFWKVVPNEIVVAGLDAHNVGALGLL